VAQVVWPQSVVDVLLDLPTKEQSAILEKVQQLERFPRMYPVRMTGRFRRHRWLLAGDWLVYYRVVESTVYIRALWPARIP
jgi:hypothetical protein